MSLTKKPGHTRKGAETDSGAATTCCHEETIGGDAQRPMAMSQTALCHVETNAAGS